MEGIALIRGELDGAITKIASGLDRSSGSAEDYAELAEALRREGPDLTGAEQAIRKAIDLDFAAPKFRRELAVILSHQGRRDDALVILSELVAEGSTDSLVHAHLAHLFAHSGDLAGAERAFRKAIELDPSESGFRNDLAGILNSRGCRDEAIAIVAKLVEDGSTDRHVHARMGYLLAQSGDLTGAERAYRRAIRLHQNLPGFRSELAVVLNHQGRREEAIAILTELIAEGSIDPHVHARLGQLLAHSDDLIGAEQALRKAIALEPSVSGFRNDLAGVLLRQGRQEEALAMVRKLVAEGIADQHAHARLGHLLAQFGDLAGAEQAFRNALELYPNLPGFHRELANVLNRQGRREEAIAILSEFIAQGSTDPHSHALLGHLLARSNDLTGAEHAFRKAVELGPETAEFRNELAGLLNNQGRREEALAILRQLVAEGSTDVHMYVRFGHLLTQSGDLAGAADTFRSATTIDPSNSGVKRALDDVLARLAEQEAEAARAAEPREPEPATSPRGEEARPAEVTAVEVFATDSASNGGAGPLASERRTGANAQVADIAPAAPKPQPSIRPKRGFFRALFGG